jgi:Family of unknown function (DUF5984)
MHVLFNFKLTPLGQVQPWGGPDDQRLHWFGLTDGQYWIQAGESAPLEYSDQLRAKFDWPRYCDYQVARLHEDLIEMLPLVLEPVPEDLISYISGVSGTLWNIKSADWHTNACAQNDDDRYWEIADFSATWIGRRTLDSLYLSPGTNIHMWSDESNVHIEWDNTGMLREGIPAWTAIRGSYLLPRDEFVAEARSFHFRFMAQMTDRVNSVLSGALPSQVKVDLQELQKEHSTRSRSIERNLVEPVNPTDWSLARIAIADIERGAYRNDVPPSGLRDH